MVYYLIRIKGWRDADLLTRPVDRDKIEKEILGQGKAAKNY